MIENYNYTTMSLFTLKLLSQNTQQKIWGYAIGIRKWHISVAEAARTYEQKELVTLDDLLQKLMQIMKK